MKNLPLVVVCFIMLATTVYQTIRMVDYKEKAEQCNAISTASWLFEPQYADDQMLYNVLSTFRVPYPSIVHAQAYLESAGYTSELFGQTHNLFGMKYPRQRITTAVGDYKGYAYYTHWVDSVIDYALWFQTYASHCETEEEVYKLLDTIYAENPDYSGIIRLKAQELQQTYYATY